MTQLADAVVADLLRLSPERATALGEHAYDDLLDDLSPDGRAATARVLRARREELVAADEGALALDDAVDLEVLRNELDRQLLSVEVLDEPSWDPLVHLPGEALHPLLAFDVLPAGERLRALVARLHAVPDRLAQAERSLGDVPAVHRDTAVQQAAGVVGLVREQVGALAAQVPALQAEVAPAQDAAVAALERYAAFLRGLPATRDPRLGPELFARKQRLVLDSATTSDEVVRAARAHLAEMTEELTRVARDWVGDVEDPVRVALGRCAAEAPDDTSIVALARQALEQATEAVRRLSGSAASTASTTPRW